MRASSFTSQSLQIVPRGAVWLLACFLTVTLWAEPVKNTRTALVIGNQRYETAVGPLRNTGNDAKAVARTLRGLGFSVIERQDVTRDQLLRAVDDFRKTLEGAEVALFYYAGHGISVAGANYLVPLKSGFDPEGADEITLRMLAETRLFNAEQAVADMSAAGAACNIVILDACRNTPLTRDTRSRGWTGSGGLSEMTPPAGSLIAFATDAGHTAFDGEGVNGLYTEELLKHLRTPGLTIEQVFKRTRAGVLQRSGGGQVPAEYSRLVGDDIYLAGLRAAVAPAREVVLAEPAAPTAPPLPTEADAQKLAAGGQAKECVAALQKIAQEKGRGDYALAPLTTLLDGVKEDLRNATAPSPKVIAAAETCELVLQALSECLPLDHPRAASLAAQACNRRGDALLLLGQPEAAIKAFDAAQPLDPDDAYILYNRGRAHLALGDKDSAKADFAAAADPRFDQPKARKLAQQALGEVK